MSEVLRVFHPADLPRCREILDSLPDWFGHAESNAGYLSRLSPTTAAVVALDTRVLGFVSLVRHNPKSVEIDVIAVARKNRAAGLGRLMMEWAESTAQAEGARWLHVKTRGPSTPDPQYEQTRGFYVHPNTILFSRVSSSGVRKMRRSSSSRTWPCQAPPPNTYQAPMCQVIQTSLDACFCKQRWF